MNYQYVGLLGTIWLMESQVYPQKLEAFNIKYIAPKQETRHKINEFLLDELIFSKFTSNAREYFLEVINSMKDDGCQAVILGCTEIPLLITQEISPLPILDSTRILARAALREAIKED